MMAADAAAAKSTRLRLTSGCGLRLATIASIRFFRSDPVMPAAQRSGDSR